VVAGEHADLRGCLCPDRAGLHGREGEFAGSLVDRFSSWHRANYGGCKGGNADVLLGRPPCWPRSTGRSRTASCGTSSPRSSTSWRRTSRGRSVPPRWGKGSRGELAGDPLLANTVKQNVTASCTRLGGSRTTSRRAPVHPPSDADSGAARWRPAGEIFRRKQGSRRRTSGSCAVHRGMTSVSTLVEALHGPAPAGSGS